MYNDQRRRGPRIGAVRGDASAGRGPRGRSESLPINFSHAEDAARLPPHHNDPFDRMLIAQAAAEGLTLVTHDRRLRPYGIQIMWT
jgi:PIN domain nuclease of toxin-antitoxin system